MNKQYADRDIEALDKTGNFYMCHILAMTDERLHDKSDIAAELAYRDMLISAFIKEAKSIAVRHYDVCQYHIKRADQLSKELSDCKEVVKDSRRLTIELDKAISGEGNEAKQISLCDLIASAKKLRNNNTIIITTFKKIENGGANLFTKMTIRKLLKDIIDAS